MPTSQSKSCGRRHDGTSSRKHIGLIGSRSTAKSTLLVAGLVFVALDRLRHPPKGGGRENRPVLFKHEHRTGATNSRHLSELRKSFKPIRVFKASSPAGGSFTPQDRQHRIRQLLP